MARPHFRTLKQMSRIMYQTEMKEAHRVARIINETIYEFMKRGYKTTYDINNGAFNCCDKHYTEIDNRNI